MSEALICSDFCEEQGFARPAELLRALCGGGRTVYVVMERGAEFNDDIIAPYIGGDPKWFFLDRDEAESVAAERNARWHRENNILRHCYELKEVTDHSAADLTRRISDILGRPYGDPDGGIPLFSYQETPFVGEPVTDDQMRKIADLFTLKFFYVVETSFAEPEPALPVGEGSSREEDRS